MALKLHDGTIYKTPTNQDIMAESHKRCVAAQRKRVAQDRTGELRRTLEALQHNMAASTADRISIDPVRVISVDCDLNTNVFNVFINRAVGDLSDNDRAVVGGGCLVSLIGIRQARCGSQLVYKLCCDVEDEAKEAYDCQKG